MNIPFSRWYPVIKTRRSRREYDPKQPIPDRLLSELRTVCDQFRPFPSARTALVTEHPDAVFKAIVGSYGKIKHPQAFIAFIGDMTDRHVQEKVGYTGEGLILEATAMQLGTCWAAGLFNPAVVATLINVAAHEKVLSVTPVGYAKEHETLAARSMHGFGRNHRRKPLSKLVTGIKQQEWPDWMSTSLEAARLSPSAINRQPWSFNIESNAVTVSIRTPGPEFNVSKRLDCGIAMLHLEVAAMSCGIKGTWEFLDSPQVARFQVTQ